MWFPIDTEVGKLINGVWEIDFPANGTRDRVLQWIALQNGPAGSSLSVYLDTIFIDTTPRGDLNRADYATGIPIAKGRVLKLIWSAGTGNAPVASIGCTDGGDTVGRALTGNSGIFTQG